jgi:hypothetical protein
MAWPDPDDDFLRRLVLSEEDRRKYPAAPLWSGGFRWFRSTNVVDLQNYRSPAEKKRIKIVLLFQDERWC